MKTHSMQKEILVITGTTFEQTKLRTINNKKGLITLRKQKQRVLDQDYWNVMLPEILPGLKQLGDLISTRAGRLRPMRRETYC